MSAGILPLVAALMVVAGALPRIAAAAGVLPHALQPFVWSDVLFTWERGLSGARVPYWDAYFEYPPVAGYVSGALSLVAPGAAFYVAAWAAVQAATAYVAAAALTAGGRRAAWAWCVAPQLALFGPINFDLLAVAALVLAVGWARSGAVHRSVAALALGTATKLFPIAALPLVVWRRRGERLPRLVLPVALFALVLAALYAPAAEAPFSSLESLGRYSVGIDANFDSLWGLVAGTLAAISVPAATGILLITSIGLAATYLAFVLPMARADRDPAIAVALAVLTVLLWSRLYSPQYSLWALPFFVLLPLPLRLLVLLTAADVTVFLTVYPLTLVRWEADDPMRAVLFAVLAAGIVARHAALLMTWLSVRRLAASPATELPPASARSVPSRGS